MCMALGVVQMESTLQSIWRFLSSVITPSSGVDNFIDKVACKFWPYAQIKYLINEKLYANSSIFNFYLNILVNSMAVFSIINSASNFYPYMNSIYLYQVSMWWYYIRITMLTNVGKHTILYMWWIDYYIEPIGDIITI